MTHSRSRLWRLLDDPVLWEITRIALDAGFGLYRRRTRILREWGIASDHLSVLDVGCGIGQYASMTSGPYLGIDLEERYVDYARRHRGNSTRTFRCIDATRLLEHEERFDVVLMVDFLHHIPDEDCTRLLAIASRLTNRYVVNFEPITRQSNLVGRWIIDHDRGDFMRSLNDLHGLFATAGLAIKESRHAQLGPITTTAILAEPLNSQDATGTQVGAQPSSATTFPDPHTALLFNHVARTSPAGGLPIGPAHCG